MREVSINIEGTPPVIELPANITEYATGPEGARVNYSATATDNAYGDVPVDAGEVRPQDATKASQAC